MMAAEREPETPVPLEDPDALVFMLMVELAAILVLSERLLDGRQP